MSRLLKKKAAALMVALSLTATMAAGCSNKGAAETQASQTGSAAAESSTETGSAKETEAVTENAPIDPKDVALKIGDMEISAPELFYYYLATRLQTEGQFGEMDWTLQMDEDGSTYGDYLKTLVESQLLQNVFWNSFADEDGIVLSDDDNEQIQENLASFNANIAEEDREFYGFNDENITKTLEHITIAGKVIEAEIQKQIAQFTDEEKQDCVFRTVQHILLKSDAPAQTNESGETETVSQADAESYKQEQKAKADEILERARNGEDFEALAEEYNEDSGFEYSLNNKGQGPDGMSYVQEFTDGAWSLKEGEMTVVETEYGYHVMKCVSENEETLTEQAQRDLAVSKYNDTYQQWLTDNNPTFYDGWKNFVVLNAPALPSSEDMAQSEAAATQDDTAQSEDVQSEDAQSADAQSEDAQSADAQSEETQSTQTQSTGSESTAE